MEDLVLMALNWPWQWLQKGKVIVLIILNKTTMKFVESIDFIFHERFLHSNAMLFDTIYPQLTSFKISHVSQTLPLLYQLTLSMLIIFFVIISTIFTELSPRVDSVSRNHFPHFKKNNSSSVKVLSWDCSNLFTSLHF